MKKYLLAALVGFLMMLVFPTSAFAAGADVTATATLSAGTVTFLIATVIPIVVGLLTKLESRWKGALMILLNAIVAAISTATLADGTAVFGQQTVEVFIKGLIGAYASYYGLLKPRGITSSAVQVPDVEPGSTLSVPGSLANRGFS